MARMKGPPNKVGETFRRFELAPDPKRRKLEKSKRIKLLDLPSNNLIRCLSIVLSLQSGQLLQRCQGNVDVGPGSDVPDIIPNV